VLHVEHLTYLVAGIAVWWPVIHGAYSAGAKAAYLFAAFVLASPLGLVLALVPRPIYSFYVHAPRTWGPGPLVDQQIAGVTMAVEQAVVFFAVFASFMLRFLRDEQAEGALDELRAPFTQHS
jgi:cytochrome c oxidase assembly factor CtaG